MKLKNIKGRIQIPLAVILLYLLMTLSTDHDKRISTHIKPFHICDDSGPTFDLTCMPDCGTLIPGPEPINLTLKLRVGVRDPDGVDTVIGSYRNDSEPWINATLSFDQSTSRPDDYAAKVLNYTVPGGYSITNWNIKFYANDSLGNWNVSQNKTMSMYRPGNGIETTSTNGNEDIGLLIGAVILIPIVIVITWYIKSKRSKYKRSSIIVMEN